MKLSEFKKKFGEGTDFDLDYGKMAMDNKTELLVILMEECAEVIQEASKLIRFPENNTDKLTKELGDLQFMINLTANHLDIDTVDIAVQMDKKRKKLETYSSLFS